MQKLRDKLDVYKIVDYKNPEYERNVVANMNADRETDYEFSINKFLAAGIGYLNGLLAFLIVLGSGLALSLLVWPFNQGDSFGWIAFIFGSFLGIIPAIIICGTLATLVSIRRDLSLLMETTAEYQSEHLTMFARSQLREMFKENQNRRRQNLRINRKARY